MEASKIAISVEIVEGEFEVYDIQVDQDESFIVNGVCLHNSATCRAYAFKIWDRDFKPIGHALPYNGGVPRHFACRSRIVPYLFDDGPNKDFTFKEWLERLSPEQQTQIFGRARIEAWKRGKLTDQDLIRSQERALTLDELK